LVMHWSRILGLAVLVVGVVSSFVGQVGFGQSESNGAAYQDTITFSHLDTINTIDPHVVSDMTHNILYVLVHETFVRYNPNTQEIPPNLATSWTWFDDTTIEFTLRDDVVLHNGEKFTADDVVYTI